MASNYPSVLDNTTDLIDNATDATVTETVHAAAHNNAADAIIAIETALGVNPFGSFSTVAAWLAMTVASGSGSPQLVQPNADVIGVIFKQHSNISTSEITVWENYAGVIKAYIDDNFIFSAQGININGTPIASTNLSDSATIAHLNSPALTGNPTAPTQSSGDNSTKLATTAFVTTAVASVNLSAYAPLNSPAFTGVPTAPTAAAGTATTQIATTAFITNSVELTGNPTAPTQGGTDNSTKIATTAFVKNYISQNLQTGSQTFNFTGLDDGGSPSEFDESGTVDFNFTFPSTPVIIIPSAGTSSITTSSFTASFIVLSDGSGNASFTVVWTATSLV